MEKARKSFEKYKIHQFSRCRSKIRNSERIKASERDILTLNQKNRRDYSWQRTIVIQTIQTKTQTQKTAILMEIHRVKTETPIRTATIPVPVFLTAEIAAEI